MFCFIFNELASLACFLYANHLAFEPTAEASIPKIMVLCTLVIWARLGNCEK